ncbi:MAG: flagellar protein FlgN [Clostridiales bacterium]|nr:flagellar protein FlgN [Clostridiales bacterium]
MDILYNEFLDILNAEKAVHEELLSLSIQKKEVLIKNDIKVLDDIVSQEKALYEKVKSFEANRESIVAKIAIKLNVANDEVTLDKIIENTTGTIKKQMLSIKKEINTVIGELSQLNDINKDLLKTHINYTIFSLDIMTQSGVAGETYDNSGYMKEDKKTRIGLIDQEA